MEKVRILGIDPSLRNSGLAIVEYDSEKKTLLPIHCQTLVNPQKFTGKDAILNMLDMLHEEGQKECYAKVDQVIIESPAVIFNKAWSAGTMASIAHISGGAAVCFDLKKVFFFRPNEWNKNRKKEVTHSQTVSLLGDPDKWHFEKRVKAEKHMEHILDAASLALFWIKNQFME